MPTAEPADGGGKEGGLAKRRWLVVAGEGVKTSAPVHAATLTLRFTSQPLA